MTDYPNNPYVGQEINVSNITFQWDGEKWISKNSSNRDVRIAALESSVAGMDLNYNALWMGCFKVWQRGSAFTPETTGRVPCADGWTISRENFANDKALIVHSLDDNKNDAARVYREVGDTSTDRVVLVANLSQSESRVLSGETVKFSARLKLGTESTSSSVKLKLQYSLEMEQPITLANGEYTSGNVVVIDEDVTPVSASFTDYEFQAAIPTNATQVSVVITIPYAGTAPDQSGPIKGDWVEISSVTLSKASLADARQPTFEEALASARKRYVSSYAYGTPKGSVTMAGSVTVLSVPSSTNTTVLYKAEFAPMISPPTFFIRSTSGSNLKIRNLDTSSDIFGQIQDITESGATVINLNAAINGNRYAFHWVAEVNI